METSSAAPRGDAAPWRLHSTLPPSSSNSWALPVSAAFLPVLFHIRLRRPEAKQNYSFPHEASLEFHRAGTQQMLHVGLANLAGVWFSTPLGHLALDWPPFFALLDRRKMAANMRMSKNLTAVMSNKLFLFPGCQIWTKFCHAACTSFPLAFRS